VNGGAAARRIARTVGHHEAGVIALIAEILPFPREGPRLTQHAFKIAITLRIRGTSRFLRGTEANSFRDRIG
jgi:hypothetical protein